MPLIRCEQCGEVELLNEGEEYCSVTCERKAKGSEHGHNSGGQHKCEALNTRNEKDKLGATEIINGTTYWYLKSTSHYSEPFYLPIDYCPFCGEKLPL